MKINEILLALHLKVLYIMKSRLLSLIAFGIVAVLLSNCRIMNPSIMLRTKKSYPFAEGVDSIPATYIIQKGDILNFRLFSNQGFKIIDLTTVDEGSRNAQSPNQQNSFIYNVETDSVVNLPIIGRIKIAGYNLKDAEIMLEAKYSNYYNDPFIMLQIQNRRITVFPGAGGAAKVIQLENQYITVIEALALAGGISEGGKAYRVKIVRGNFKDPEIFSLDLSTPKGLAEANTYYVRANDILYVQSSYFAGKKILSTTTQILGLVSNIILTYVLIATLNSRV
jgi:polysaccharide biosynthesis/export protein